MKRFLIEEAKRTVTKGGPEWEAAPASVVVTVKYKEDAAAQWLNMVEFEGVPNVFLSDRDIFDKLVEEDFEDQAFADYLNTHFIEDFNGITMGEYAAVFDSISNDPENEAVPLVRYMILLARSSADEAEALIEMSAGKYADEIEIPESDVEREHRGEVDYSFLDTLDEESLYRLLLTLQTDSESVSVFHDIDPEGFAEEKDQLAVVLERCKDQAGFEAWKNAFISEEYEKSKNQKFITCKYVFVNMGQYETTIPTSGKETFLEWINGSGAGFFESDREATEAEIKQYIALHAADHLE
ncbi:MAG: hypothetical protein IKF93_03040 [Lachnospiraceae bacterium]|nr:hypothetical protein [Lachnospiraceae bacterium]